MGIEKNAEKMRYFLPLFMGIGVKGSWVIGFGPDQLLCFRLWGSE